MNVSQKGRRGWGIGASMKLWRGEKFHPAEIDLTQEERGARADINTARNKTE